MMILFNVSGESRKAMVKAIEDELGVKATYLGVPSCAYQIGDFKVGKLGELEFADGEMTEKASKVIDACILATGVTPDGLPEAESNQEEEVESAQVEEAPMLTISVPLDKVKVGNLTALVDAKAGLIRKALGVQDLRIDVDEEKVSFPWFSGDLDSDTVQAYTQFVEALCKMSVNQKRVQAREKPVENEKYAFRCYLLRLGFIGAEYKQTRKVLLKNFEGSSAFRTQEAADKYREKQEAKKAEAHRSEEDAVCLE